eukprot:3425653-Rhodomonas_salina.1
MTGAGQGSGVLRWGRGVLRWGGEVGHPRRAHHYTPPQVDHHRGLCVCARERMCVCERESA